MSLGKYGLTISTASESTNESNAVSAIITTFKFGSLRNRIENNAGRTTLDVFTNYNIQTFPQKPIYVFVIQSYLQLSNRIYSYPIVFTVIQSYLQLPQSYLQLPNRIYSYPNRIYSYSTRSTHSLHTLHTLSTRSLHTLYTLSTHSLHTLYTLSTHTLHTLWTHSLDTHSRHSLHTVYTLIVHSWEYCKNAFLKWWQLSIAVCSKATSKRL